MNEIEKFRQQFADAYINGEVNYVGMHSTNGDWAKSSLRRGLKWFPIKYKIIRREMGVHFDRLAPAKKKLDRREFKKEFDILARAKASFELCEQSKGDFGLPGLVLLKEGIPRERKYGESYKIFSHHYVPVARGLENTTHVLVPGEFIHKVIFLTNDEAFGIIGEADEQFGDEISLNYKKLKKKISQRQYDNLEEKRSRYIGCKWGTLLLYKSRDFLIK